MIENAPGLFIAAPSSGSGKTLVTLALLRAFMRAGVRASSAKVGPDYIDPAFHSAASGRDCVNIDPWAMRTDLQFQLKENIGQNADIIICEGVMGLFDGARDGTGATADLSAKFNWPVIMVVDVRGQATSAVASLKGFVDFRADVNIAGVIFNKVGAGSHQAMLERAMAEYLPNLKVLGYLPRNGEMVMPERHLGLVQASENKDLQSFLNKAAVWVSDHIDMTSLQALGEVGRAHVGAVQPAITPIGQRISIAKDAAFTFCYPSLLDAWHKAGAEINFFSPLADETPTKTSDAVYLPGGYPELHAGKLAGNSNFMAGLQKAALENIFIYGECGGYMTLGESLTDGDGACHKMLGLLPVETSFLNRKLHLGYRQATLLSDCPLGAKGRKFKGHEFHYASIITENPDNRLFNQVDALGGARENIGHVNANVCGSYLHLIDHVDD